MIINKKYRKWLPIPIIVGIVIIQTVAILSILGYHWLIEKGMIPQGRDTAITGAWHYIIYCFMHSNIVTIPPKEIKMSNLKSNEYGRIEKKLELKMELSSDRLFSREFKNRVLNI